MAISNRAREQLHAFAAEAGVAAAIAAAPWRAARLNSSSATASVGQTITLSWSAPAGGLPVFIRVGAHEVWEQVAAEGQREVQIELSNLPVALRVGPHIASELTIRCVIPRPTLQLYPEGRLVVPCGSRAHYEIYAAYAKQVEVYDESGARRTVPNICAIEIEGFLMPRVVNVTASGWDGTIVKKSLRIEVSSSAEDSLFHQMVDEIEKGKVTSFAN